MDTKVNYMLVGLFTILLAIALTAIIFWLSAAPVTKNYQTYLAYMRESVAGLNMNAAVKYRGVDVGRVEAIELDKQNPERVRLTLAIEQDTPIKEDTIAILASNGLTGIAYVELTGGTQDSPTLQAEKDQPYPVIQTGPSLLMRLDTALTKLLTELTGVAGDLSRIAQSVNTVLIEQNQQALAETLSNAERLSKALADLATNQENQQALRKTLHNTEYLTARLAGHGSQLETAIEDLVTILEAGAKASKQLPILVEQASRSLRPIERTAKGLETLLRDGEQGFRLFTQSTLPRINQLLNDFERVTRNLERFSQQVEQNPRTLLFGSPPNHLGPGE
ncbi:MlaD family protein [Nitrosococcus wardiae]|uniref:MCE family protein n=1 Tax=Nitrosococcus wardiae TaxID=1814290 RepID=A0A4P7BWG6_9GAMM|nr:MlaD family protein [Nitrosococcus wardiae]QBQ53434.1 MCE family protein [Nitrosococcus wardiae]